MGTPRGNGKTMEELRSKAMSLTFEYFRFYMVLS